MCFFFNAMELAPITIDDCRLSEKDSENEATLKPAIINPDWRQFHYVGGLKRK
jgi:hypothetical protein